MSIDRRALVTGLASAPLATAACSALPGSAHALTWTDATETADLIRRRKISAHEAVKAAVDRAAEVNPQLNFLADADFERALKRSDQPLAGPFAGVPFLVKDLLDLEGLPTRNGSRALKSAPPAKASAPVIDAFLAAGFIPIGKSTTPEFGFLPTTEPLGAPPTRNPWDTTRSSGGSSGGSAVAVAAGVVPVAQASDGGGSIRIPSSCCGVFGLKPSRGRIIGSTNDPKEISVKNCVARTVRDAAGVFAAIEKIGPDATLPPVGMVQGASGDRLRIGWIAEDPLGRIAEKPVVEATARAARLCSQLGHTVEPLKWPPISKDFTRAFLIAWSQGADEAVKQITAASGRRPDLTQVEPFTLAMADYFAGLPKEALEKAFTTVEAGAYAYLGLFKRFDVVLTPVLSRPPVPLGWVRGDVPFKTLEARLIDYVGYTPIVNVAGNTAMSVPLSWTDSGLPVGAHFAAATGRERTLFELAYELEKAQPWAHRHPPIHA
jgi:amidase